MSDSQSSIKKSSFKYVHCQHGGLHDGQVMNLVCVDSTCTKRGLICPICKMQQHETHQILPIKSFLQEIRSMFMQTGDNQQQLNSLSDYLRALQNAKKQIINNLKNQIERLAQGFKELEAKIQESFISIRKNVLIQSSITTKLPTLLTILSEENINKDPQMVQQQFTKYTELLKYENDKLKVSDNAKKLVQTYASVPSKFLALLKKSTDDFVEKIESFPKILEGKVEKKVADAAVTQYTFSEENKFFQVKIEEQGKMAVSPDYQQDLVYVFVKQGKGQKNQKLNVQIVANNSGTMIAGLGDVDEFRNSTSFINNGTMEDRQEFYDFLYCSGDIRIPPNDMNATGVCSVTFETGHKLSMEYNGTDLIFHNKTTNLKHVSKPNFSDEAKKNIQFVFSLAENDSIRIVDQ